MTVAISDEQAQKKGRRTLLLVLAVSVMPVAAAYIMFFTGIGVPSNTVNNGVLMEKPLSIKEIMPAEQWESVTNDKKWRLLLPLGETCDAACEKNLYTTRQVHIRLADKSGRLERYLVSYGGTKSDAYAEKIKPEHPLLKHVSVSKRDWLHWIEQSPIIQQTLSQPYYLLVDQEGGAMMVYTEKQHGNELLKDIKRALKYSIDYQ